MRTGMNGEYTVVVYNKAAQQFIVDNLEAIIANNENRSNKKHKNFYRITSPGGVVWERQWLVSKEEMDKLLQEDKIYFGKAPKYDGVPRAKIFNDSENYIIPKNIIGYIENTSNQAQKKARFCAYASLFFALREDTVVVSISSTPPNCRSSINRF